MTEDELILTHLFKCSRSEFYLRNYTLTPEQQHQFDFIKSRREQGEPLQYILGTCNFMGLNFKVDFRVLIPRPETEGLVDEAVKRIKESLSFSNASIGNPESGPPIQTFGGDIRILDLGTGSGCISVTLAKLLPTSLVMSVDVSQDALDVAKENAIIHGVSERIHFVCADMLVSLREAEGDVAIFERTTNPSEIASLVASLLPRNDTNLFDLIISNPPYIPDELLPTLPADVQHEPALALKGGKDGLAFYRHIIKYTPCLLREGGYLMMEFGDGQGNAVQELVSSQKGFGFIQIHQDLAGRDRFVSAQKM